MLIITFIIGFQNTVFAQEVKTLVKEALSKETIQEESFPIPGSHLLREEERKIRDYIITHPEWHKLAKISQTAWNFHIGDTKTWWATDIIENTEYEVPATCQAIGTNCYVFVEDAIWNSRIDLAAVNAVVDAFDNTTPADAPNNDGIFNVDTRTFGTPPDVDTDPRIIILILDIQDDYNGDTIKSYVAGYFFSINEYADGDPAIGGRRSNFGEIFYMDCNPADLMSDNGRFNVFGTTAHEFQHMIHWEHDPDESDFVNEGLSMIAEYICGYGLRSNSRYAQNTNVNLLSWGLTDDVLDDYARAALWTLYIYEQFPIEILKDFVDRIHGRWPTFNGTFGIYDATRDFWSFFEDWLIANYLNDTSIDSKYGYNYSPLSKPVPVATHIGNSGQGSGTLEPIGAEYITFSGGDDITITFSGVGPTDDKFIVKALKIGSLEVENVPRDVPYSPSGYGTNFSEVTFLVYNSHSNSIQNYTYVSIGTAVTGTFELAYEDGEPDGYAPAGTWANPGDSVAVKFDGIAGAILDSVRFAFRRNGTIQMDISNFDGTTFLRGNNLFGPVQVYSPDSTDNYPVPYDNWVTYDLSMENIDASNDFVVSLLLGSNTSEPGIMVSAESTSGHSFWYDSIGDRWDPINITGGIANYCFRAYVSVGSGTVAIDQTGIVSIPDEFTLEQNYPNPFNPSTTFRFSTPKDGLVKFTVHDLLGRVVYSENRNLFAGNYSFKWEGKNQLDQQVVSGVYFLRMEAEEFSQTRKMLMMK